MIPPKVLEAHYEELKRVMFDIAQYTLDKQEITISFPIGDIKLLINGRYETKFK